jgi:hypothetical protein
LAESLRVLTQFDFLNSKAFNDYFLSMSLLRPLGIHCRQFGGRNLHCTLAGFERPVASMNSSHFHAHARSGAIAFEIKNEKYALIN